MENLKDKTVAQIVTENIKTSDVFKKAGIDFCCGGNLSLSAACLKNGLEVSEIESEIAEVLETKKAAFDFNNWKLDFLIDFILNTHHEYVKANSPLLLEYSEKVNNAHGSQHPEVSQINKLTIDLIAELTPHLKKEEKILFPYIKKLLVLKSKNKQFQPDGFTVQNPIKIMNKEHDAAGDIIKKIALLSNNFTVPEDACNTFKAFYAKLEEFQNDLFNHVHLENNILFPKAILLEEELIL